jgi:hypothetical protein
MESSVRHKWPCRLGSSPCENAKTLDRDRTSYSFNTALGAQAASPFTFEIEPENIILVALRVFEFSHSLGHSRPGRIDSKSGDVRYCPVNGHRQSVGPPSHEVAALQPAAREQEPRGR